ncbi:MAG: hypothetical protein J6M48_07680 [Ruminococcus sp.]|nr:hypothetical protein [Ruminococcus sp.]
MDNNGEYTFLNTKAFDAFIEQKESILQRYNGINSTYDEIVRTLLDNWIGRGADAFRSDAKKVKENISGIYDVLKLMCDTLTDCRQVFAECDHALGDFNRNPDAD